VQDRGVAQPGSAPALGAGGLRFKSGRPDHIKLTLFCLVARPPLLVAASKTWLKNPGPILGHGFIVVFDYLLDLRSAGSLRQISPG
jgi:hypothetical protein